MPTESRTYIGETGTQAYDGGVDLALDHPYPLNCAKENDEVQLTHGLAGAGILALTSVEAERWAR